MALEEPETADRGQTDSGSPKVAPDQLVQRYWREIDRYKRAARGWEAAGRSIERKYTDADRAKHDDQDVAKSAQGPRCMAMLWSTVETIKPAVYAKTPMAVVSRRFKDADKIGRIAAEILERASNSAADLYHFDETFRLVRDDRLLPGRGVGWVRYEASFDETPEQPAQGVEGQDGYQAAVLGSKKLRTEKVCLDHVHWSDFGHNVSRTWQETWLVFRKVYKFRHEVEERFGSDLAKALTYDIKVQDDEGLEESQRENKACLYELWDKRRRKMCFLAKGWPKLIEDEEPPLKLQDFFPCPEPAYASKASDSLIPRADYHYYRDQAEEIDQLTAKISELTDWLTLKGFIPDGADGDGASALSTLLMQKGKQIIIPIPGFQGYVEKGGIKQIDWLPLDLVIQALEGAIKSRAEMINNLYQVNGVADILRGSTDPDETLGAIELKAQTGSRRIKNTKDELARHARDCYRLVCEVIADNFQPETLAAITGFKYISPQEKQLRLVKQQMAKMQGLGGLPGMPAPQGGGPQPGQPGMPPGGPPMPQPGMPQPDTVSQPQLPGAAGMVQDQQPGGGDVQEFDDEVMQRLRDDRIRGYSIDIETDSTVQPDENLEKQAAVEFAGMVGGIIEKAAALFQIGPMAAPIAPVVMEMLKFVVRRFRAGKAMEDVIERATDQLLKMIADAASKPPPPSPEEQKAQLDAKLAERQVQMDEAAEQRNAQREAQKMQHEQAINERQLMAEEASQQRKAAQEEKALGLEWQIKMKEFQMAMQKMDREEQRDQAKHAREMEALSAQVVADREMAKSKAAAAKNGNGKAAE